MQKTLLFGVFLFLYSTLAFEKITPLRTTNHLVIIDNYDSFTFNLVHYFEGLGCQVTVFRNDQFELDELADFEAIVLSPGPGLPKDAGLTMQVLHAYATSKKILGICLGHQAIGEFFGATLENLKTVVHGTATELILKDPTEKLYQNLPSTIEVGRYHSWAISPVAFPNCLSITAVDKLDCILSVKHNMYDITGIQYHPESILTPHGKTILTNWLAN